MNKMERIRVAIAIVIMHACIAGCRNYNDEQLHYNDNNHPESNKVWYIYSKTRTETDSISRPYVDRRLFENKDTIPPGDNCLFVSKNHSTIYTIGLIQFYEYDGRECNFSRTANIDAETYDSLSIDDAVVINNNEIILGENLQNE